MEESVLSLCVQDAIHEIRNIGVEAAATSLFSLIHKLIETTSSILEQLDFMHMFNQGQGYKSKLLVFYFLLIKNFKDLARKSLSKRF